MAPTAKQTVSRRLTLPKAASGIDGLDEITGGGLPRGRPTLVCGSAGCGKTLFAVEFLVRGASQFNEPGVFLAFEETPEELAQNVRSLGFDLDALAAKKKLLVDFVQIDRSEIEEAGEYDLEGLFIRLGHAIDSIGAKRVALDTLETLFGGLSNVAILRAELRRLFRWLKDRGVTAVITAERGAGALTRHGLEEYVSDCVILLDNRVVEEVTTRRLRIVKYRGTTHGTNEYPFLIDADGISILPVTSLGLQHQASNERASTGIARLDEMLGGKGLYRGSSVLISGSAGTGKTSLSASIANAACARGERSLYCCFEESPSQLMRNMRSIRIDFMPWVKKGLLRFHAARPTAYGLEMHLATLHKLVQDFEPHVVVIDPITTFLRAGTSFETESMLMRLIDHLKALNITAVLTSLTHAGSAIEATDASVSSLIDTWLLVRELEMNGERNRGIYVLKSRGMGHSNKVREFILTDDGIELVDVYVGPNGVLTGSMRIAQEARRKEEIRQRQLEVARRTRQLERKRRTLEDQLAMQLSELEAEQNETLRLAAESTVNVSDGRAIQKSPNEERENNKRAPKASRGRK